MQALLGGRASCGLFTILCFARPHLQIETIESRGPFLTSAALIRNYPF